MLKPEPQNRNLPIMMLFIKYFPKKEGFLEFIVVYKNLK